MRDSNRYIEIDGVRRSVNEWAEIFGISAATLRKRLSRRWPVEKLRLPIVSKTWTGKNVAGIRHKKDYLSDWDED